MRFAWSPANSVAIAVAVYLVSWSARPLIEGGGYLGWAAVLVGIAGVIGAIGAVAQLPRLVTILAQTLGMGGLLVWLAGRNGTGPLLDQVQATLAEGIEVVRRGRIPLPEDPALVWVLLLALAAILVTVELLVNALEQPAWAIVPLGILYAIAALVLPDEVSVWSLVALTVGYVLVLLVATGFGTTRSHAGTGPRLGFELSRAAVVLGFTVLAVAAAALITPAIPMAAKQPWLEGTNRTPIQLEDPQISLNENLQRPEETEVLRYRTSTGQGTYLRSVAMTKLTVSGAQLVPMQLSSGQLGGAYRAPGTDVETTIRMSAPSEYLPAPFAPKTFAAEGRWAHDPTTLAIVATGEDRLNQTAGLEYTVNSQVPEPSREELEAAGFAEDPHGRVTLEVPPGLDPQVRQFTNALTADAPTAGAKAIAIQNFLRSEEFTYSLDAPQSTSMDAISSFILEDRSGYCIHFAAAMITMARLEGIPARMAVGYTPGTKDGDEFVVTTHNMHAWPELYLDGLGWVPFEPTKQVAAPPSWSAPDPDQPSPTAPATPTASPTPTPTPTPSASTPPTTTPPQSPPPRTDNTPREDQGSFPWGWVLGGLALLALLAAPAVVRLGMRSHRLRAGQDPAEQAENAWRELEATFRDLGLPWSQRSPGPAVAELRPHISGLAAEHLAVVADAASRGRYARHPSNEPHLAQRVTETRQAILVTQPRGRRLRAALLPASLLPRSRNRQVGDQG